MGLMSAQGNTRLFVPAADWFAHHGTGLRQGGRCTRRHRVTPGAGC